MVMEFKQARNRENIEAHAHNVALRDMPRTAFPIPVFAVPGLKNHQHSSMIRIVLRLSLSLHVRSAQEWSWATRIGPQLGRSALFHRILSDWRLSVKNVIRTCSLYPSYSNLRHLYCDLRHGTSHHQGLKPDQIGSEWPNSILVRVLKDARFRRSKPLPSCSLAFLLSGFLLSGLLTLWQGLLLFTRPLSLLLKLSCTRPFSMPDRATTTWLDYAAAGIEGHF